MLGKLLKHDFKALFRNYSLLFAVLLLVTLLYKVCLLLPKNIVLNFTNGLMGALYVIVILGCLFGAAAINIVRFYKNLVTDEGYLTFTLPVSSKQIVASKLISTLVMDVLMAVAVLLSTLVLRSNLPVLAELYQSIEEALHQIASNAEYRPLIVSVVGYSALACIYTQMGAFTAVAIGQTNRTHKIAAGVGAYALIYFLTQCVMGVVVFLWAQQFHLYNINIDVANIDVTPIEVLHAANGLFFIVGAVAVVLGVACFFLTDYLFAKKLNLE